MTVKARLASDKTARGREPTIAFKAVVNIARRWGLSEEELAQVLGGVGKSTLLRWKAQLASEGAIRADFGPDMLDRVSYLLGIYKALHILFPDSAQADAWVRKPNSALGFYGRSALERMLRGRMDDLRFVRRHLDAWRG